ncbi:Fic/DOC family protein [Corynebacterium halotolerans]|uniref:Fic/DOC family protein n=1 Tax=Corynebacterium halotolerans TaxID=225326 RepID=UPI003CEA30D4
MTDLKDPYYDDSGEVLRNLVGAATPADLAVAEADLVFARTVQLDAVELPDTRDLAELQAIHRHLFQDVYPWAGEVRTVDIRRSEEGFLPVVALDRAAGIAASDLHTDHYLQGLDRERFVARLAHHYDQFNYIHPFREGNGRTQRVFWTRVAAAAGWELDWRNVSGEDNDRVSRIAAEERNLTPLVEMLERVVVAEHRPQQGQP